MDAGALDEAVRRLRHQLRVADEDANLIKSRRGIGYMIEM
jgi:DNA-binding response OmpR family regulator